MERRVRRRVRRGVRGAGLGPGGVTHWALSPGRRTQAAPAGSARSFPGCQPSPASSSGNSAPGPGEMDNQDLPPAGCLSTAPLPGAGARRAVAGGGLAAPRQPHPDSALGAARSPLAGSWGRGPSARLHFAPRAWGLPPQLPPPPRAAALTSLPSSGRMSPLSCLRLSLMRARRRFSSSGFRLCGRAWGPRSSGAQARPLLGRSAPRPQSPAPTLRSSAGSPALRGSPMLDGEPALLRALRAGGLLLPGRGAETGTQREVGRARCRRPR